MREKGPKWRAKANDAMMMRLLRSRGRTGEGLPGLGRLSRAEALELVLRDRDALAEAEATLGALEEADSVRVERLVSGLRPRHAKLAIDVLDSCRSTLSSCVPLLDNRANAELDKVEREKPNYVPNL